MTPRFIHSPEEVRKLSARPHPPIVFKNEKESEELAERAWEVLRQLEAEICTMGYASNLEKPIDFESDFYMNDDVGTFRMLSFEVRTRSMLKRELLVRVAEFLQGLQEDYTVFISCDFNDSLELFMIVVTRHTAFGQFENAITAEAFGFDPDSGFIGPIA